MADQILNYECPACGGPLHFSGETGKLQCDYCDSAFEAAEIEALYREKEERAAKTRAEQEASHWNTSGFDDEWGEAAAGMKTYSCPTCDAQMVCDENTAVTCCPYCGNQSVITGQFTGALKPEYIIPFRTNQASAVAALKNHYKGKALLPKSFVDGNHVEDIQGVYVPFWMFDAQGEGDIRFHATTSTTTRSGNTETTVTKHYDVRRRGKVNFEKVPVDASKRMPDGHMDSIEPYDYKELCPFSTVYMPGFLAERYDVSVEECGERMEKRCSEATERALTDTVTGYDTKRVKEKNILIKKGDVHYAMLPVWLLATKWNDQTFLFAMNGQSGKLVGDLPMDKGKYFGYLGGIFAALIAICSLLNFFVMSEPASGLAALGFCLGLPLLIAFVTVSVMKSQLKSVVGQGAKVYINKSGLTLDVKTDTFMNTTTERRRIENKS